MIIESIIGALVSKGMDIFGSKVGVDMDSDAVKSAKLAVESEIRKAAYEIELKVQEANLRQVEVNVEEAKNANMFVAGWRPAIGWICALALGYHYLLQPLLVFTLATIGHAVALPVFDMQSLMTILMGMLGLGAMRSYEKVYGTARDTLKIDGSYYNEQAAATKPKPMPQVGDKYQGGTIVNDPVNGGLTWIRDPE